MAQKTDWMKSKPADLEKKVIELAKQGLSAEKIGLKLRDELGIPTLKVFKLKIKKILEAENLWQDPEIRNLNNKIDIFNKHSQKNIHDYKAKRSSVKTLSRLNKLKKR